MMLIFLNKILTAIFYKSFFIFDPILIKPKIMENTNCTCNCENCKAGNCKDCSCTNCTCKGCTGGK